MTKFYFLLFILLHTSLYGNYPLWIDNQLQLIQKINDENLSREEVTVALQNREKLYDSALEMILLNKEYFLNLPSNDKEIFSLKKIMSVNKRQGNNYAFLRDEVKVKSYELLTLQNKMIKNIFYTLDSSLNLEIFEERMYKLFSDTQSQMDLLNDKDYHSFLKLEGGSKVVKTLQKNIRDYYGLREIIFDVFRYFVVSKSKMYRLNKYEKYGILSPILAIEHYSFVKRVDQYLNRYDLSVVKLILFSLVLFIIYLLYKLFIKALNLFFKKRLFFRNYRHQVVQNMQHSITTIFSLIAIEIIFYIYNDFNSSYLKSFFNVLYTLFITILIYKIVNSIAYIQIANINQSKKKVKSELFNITIKIINFLVILIGLLFMLYFAGVNLTTVLSGLGIGGFAVALAARETLSSFFATISILMSDIFSQGDLIESKGEVGTVVEIGLRATTIRTAENAIIVIPNTSLVNANVKNWSRRVVGRRIKIILRLNYDAKPTAIQQAIKSIREMLQLHTGIATDKFNYNSEFEDKSTKLVLKDDELGIKKALNVNLNQFSDSNIEILVYCYTKTTSWDEWLKIKEDIMYKIMYILEKEELSFFVPILSIENKK